MSFWGKAILCVRLQDSPQSETKICNRCCGQRVNVMVRFCFCSVQQKVILADLNLERGGYWVLYRLTREAVLPDRNGSWAIVGQGTIALSPHVGHQQGHGSAAIVSILCRSKSAQFTPLSLVQLHFWEERFEWQSPHRPASSLQDRGELPDIVSLQKLGIFPREEEESDVRKTRIMVDGHPIHDTSEYFIHHYIKDENLDRKRGKVTQAIDKNCN